MDKLSSENKFAMMPEWVIDLDISHTAFRLYAVLARYADNVTHQAFPSLDTLANRLGCSEKTVRRAIEDLVKHGAITKHNRGRYQSSLYTVMTGLPKGSKVSKGGSKMSLVGSKMSKGVDTDDQVTIPNELEPRELEPTNYISPLFEQFWDIYPAKKGKGSAAAAFTKALKRVSANELLEAVTRFRDDPHRPSDFTPHPTTWLNQDRWGDDVYQKPDRDKTNSERNVENLRNAMSLLENTKEVERGQVTGESVTDFGVSFRSAEDI